MTEAELAAIEALRTEFAVDAGEPAKFPEEWASERMALEIVSLRAEVRRLRGLVASAYAEGLDDGCAYSGGVGAILDMEDANLWARSKAAASLG